MNESYSYAFSFTSIRIHNREVDGREGFSEEERRHAPACIKKKKKTLQAQKAAGGTTAPTSHHTDDLSCSFSLSSLLHLKHFSSHSQLPPTHTHTHTYLPAATVWAVCTFCG